MKALRFLYLPNEAREGDQVGPRKAFAKLREDGVLAAYQAYSYLVERSRARDHRAAVQELRATVEAFQPDVVFVQHLNDSYPLTRADLQALKGVASTPKLVWHDGDAYGRWIKPLDATMKASIAESDMAVLVGLGYLAREVRRAGARRVLLAPHSFDDVRFGQPWRPTIRREHDAIMIANLTCLKRIPFLHMPGGARRKRLARTFHAAYGDRYAVFGSGQGWRGEPYCRGPIAFDAQERTIRSSWLTINWGQFDGLPWYSSDRLPISLAAGVPHISNRQRGYEHLFADAPGLYLVDAPDEALDVADALLSMPRARLIEIGANAAVWARHRLQATRVYSDIVTAIREQLFASA